MLPARYIIFVLLFFYVHLPAAHAQNKTALSQAVDIFSDLPINDPAANSYLNPGENAAEKIRKNIFVNAVLNKTSCYKGEPILLSFELLSALKSTSTIERLPAFDGFLIIQMDPNNDFPKYRKKGGLSFNVFTIKQLQLIPDREGDIEIGPVTVNNEVSYSKNKKDLSYAGTVESKPTILKVLPLPAAGRPENFTGAIGNFAIRASLQSDTVPAGENNKLLIEISGSGNFHSLQTPAVSWPGGFHDFVISERSKIDEQVFPSKGNKIISIPFIADNPGNYNIPSIELDYFDPSVSKYKKTVSAMIRLVVRAPLTNSKTVATTPVIMPQPPAASHLWLYIVIAGLVLFGLIAYAIHRNNKRKRMQVAILAAAAAEKQEEASLKAGNAERINRSIASLDDMEPGEELVIQLKQALIAFLQEKLNMPAAWPQELIATAKANDQQAGNEIEKLLHDCDQLLYTHILPGNETKEKLILGLHAVVAKIESIQINK